jgi:hypothetical protein
VLRNFGEAAVDHLLARYLDAAADRDLRAALADVLAGIGVAALPRIVDGFDGGHPALERGLVGVVGRMGDGAVPVLRELYGRGGTLRLLGLRTARGLHRKKLVLRSLAAIGTPAAIRALEDLAATETDPDLRAKALRLRRGREEGT